MDEYIKREDALNVDFKIFVNLFESKRKCAEKAVQAYANKIAEIPAADVVIAKSKPKWIPVSERLPEEYKDVLCYYEYFRYGDYNCMFRTIDRGYYGDGRWGGEAGQGHKNKVLAWMPLPEPPKEET